MDFYEGRAHALEKYLQDGLSFIERFQAQNHFIERFYINHRMDLARSQNGFRHRIILGIFQVASFIEWFQAQNHLRHLSGGIFHRMDLAGRLASFIEWFYIASFIEWIWLASFIEWIWFHRMDLGKIGFIFHRQGWHLSQNGFSKWTSGFIEWFYLYLTMDP